MASAGSYGARQIGNLYHPTDSKTLPINWLEHKFLHGLLGATMGAALSKDHAKGLQQFNPTATYMLPRRFYQTQKLPPILGKYGASDGD
jgi:hypothetical protein